jgi:hypothetical protein
MSDHGRLHYLISFDADGELLGASTLSTPVGAATPGPRGSRADWKDKRESSVATSR